MQSLRVLTYNVSGGNVSALSHLSLSAKYAAVAREVLRHAPHLITLQEVFPRVETAPLVQALTGAGFGLCGSVESHCGYTQVWVHSSLHAEGLRCVGPVAITRIPLPLPPRILPGITSIHGGQGGGAAAGGAAAGPPVAAAGAGEAGAPETAGAAGAAASAAGTAGAAASAAGTAGGRTLPPVEGGVFRCIFFAGCHLEPFPEGARYRLRQVEATLRSLPPRSRIILAGDCNMRSSENGSVAALGLSDAFLQLGSPPTANSTWDTHQNHYYGPDTRRYRARFDRVYLRGLEATQLQIVANQPSTAGGGDFLSDHFGLLADVRVLETAPPSPPEALRPSGERMGPPKGGRAEQAEAEGRAVRPRTLF